MKLRILISLIVIVALMLMVNPLNYRVQAIERHAMESNNKLDLGNVLKLINDTLEQLKDYPDLYTVLSKVKANIENGDYEGLKDALSEFRGEVLSKIYDGSINNLPDPLKYNLAQLFSLNIEKSGEELSLTISVETLNDIIKLLSTSIKYASTEDVIENLERLKGILENYPEMVSKVEKLIDLLSMGDYTEASSIYSDLVLDLNEMLPELLEREDIKKDELLQILKNLPTTITNLGPIETSIKPFNINVGIKPEIFPYIPKLPSIPLPTLNTEILKFKDLILWLILVIVLTTLIIFVVKSSKGYGVLKRKIMYSLSSSTAFKSVDKPKSFREKIIAMYLSMLKILKTLGIVKDPYETPREYLEKLKMTKIYNDAREITEKYEIAQYSIRAISEKDYEETLKHFKELVKSVREYVK